MPRISQCCLVKATENKWLEAVWWDCPKCRKDCKTYDEASYKAGQQAGRQEVVDYFNGNLITHTQWQAKLKEWGIS